MRRFIRISQHTPFHHHRSFSDPHSRSRAELEVIADHHRDAAPSPGVTRLPASDDRPRTGHQRVA